MSHHIPVWTYLKEYKETKDEILKAVTDVFESGTLILGQKGKDFERAYSDYIGTKYGVGCDNGTNAIWLALKALGIGHDDDRKGRKGDQKSQDPYPVIKVQEIRVDIGA